MRGREEEPRLHHGVKHALYHAPREGQPSPRGLTLPFPRSPDTVCCLRRDFASSWAGLLPITPCWTHPWGCSKTMPELRSRPTLRIPWGTPGVPLRCHRSYLTRARGGRGGSRKVPLRLSSRQHPHRIGPFPREHSMGTGSASTAGVLSREEMLWPPATPRSLRHCWCDQRWLRSSPSDPERHPAPAPSLFISSSC